MYVIHWDRDKSAAIFQTTFSNTFFNDNIWILITISLTFVALGPINNISALAQKMAWCRPGVKPLSAPMMFWLPTHKCVIRPQWVKGGIYVFLKSFICHNYTIDRQGKCIPMTYMIALHRVMRIVINFPFCKYLISAFNSWLAWHTQPMMKSWHENAFHITGPLCGESSNHPWASSQRASS